MISRIRKTLFIIIAFALPGVSAAHAAAAYDPLEEEARDHGYNTAALEVYCEGTLTVTDPELRTKLDQLYRGRGAFLLGYQSIMVHKRPASAQSLRLVCGNAAGNSQWLRFDPAAR